MGRIFLVELENAENKVYYCCHGCQTADGSKTYIALEENFLNRVQNLTGEEVLIFSTIVNEVNGYNIHGQTDYGAYIVDQVYCVKCLTLLGYKYISAPEINALEVGHFLMDRSKLTKWRGNEEM